ncbi:MAG TPA: hypothetical protein VF181_01955 [Balneolaceae bacterium]
MPRCEIYQDSKGQWRWRRTAKNGDIEAYADNGFDDKKECEKDGKEKGNCTSFTRANSY